MQGDVEVVHVDDAWRVRVQGKDLTSHGYDTKDDAVAAGREQAERLQVELIVKNQDGTISEKQSHGNDPRNIPG